MNRTQFPYYIQTAHDALDKERHRTAAEQQAFAQFHGQLTTIDPDQAQTDGSLTASTTVRTLFGAETKTNGSASEQIRTSYRETVMAVPHYSDEYDESLAENMSAEFGPDLATPVIENDPVTPQLRDGLLNISHHVHKSRAQLVAAIDQEAASLTTAAETLTDIERTLYQLTPPDLESESFDDLYEKRRTLLEFEERCETLAQERQRELHDRDPLDLRATEAVIQEYLYQSLSITYPVLADVTDLVEDLRQVRQRVDRGLMITS
jgi:hypothetical protein